MKFNTKSAATPLLLIASERGDTEVAVYATADGQRIVCNAGLELFSPADGQPMTAVAADKTEKIAASYVSKKLVSVGSCTGCAAKLVASGTMADTIETAGNGLHCPRCATEVSAAVDMQQMMQALSSEYDEDGDDEFGDDDVDADADADVDASADDGDVSDDADVEGDDSSDEDFGDDDADEDFGDDDADEDDEDDLDDDSDLDDDADEDEGMDDDSDEDEGLDDDADEDEGMDDEVASEDDGEEAPAADATEDDEAVEDGTAEMAAARKISSRARRLSAVGRRKSRRFQSKATAGEDVTDENGDPDDGQAEAIASKQLEAIASKLFKKGRKLRTAFKAKAEDEGMDDADAGADGEEFDPATIAGDEGNRDDKTPGTDDVTGAPASAELPGNPPGTVKDSDDRGDDGNGDDSVNKVTPATDEVIAVAGDLTVDWSKAPIELIASEHSASIYVMADGRPVATLNKDQASASVQAQWSNAALLKTAFITVARTGLKATAAAEFGFAPIAYTAPASAAMRHTIRRATETASERATDEAKRSADRFQQCVKTAALASVKGVFPDLKNPMRSALVARLHRVGVGDAGNLVDSALASSVDAWAVGVFAKASEIYNKPEAARNEVASYVAKANFTSTGSPSENLSTNLVAGSVALPAQQAGERATAGVTTPATQTDRVRQGLASIQRSR